MCGANKRFLLYLLLALLLSCVAGALRAEEPEPAAYMPMYLISDGELRSIENYRADSEREKRNWLSQVSELKAQAVRLNGRAAILRAESENSNRLLRQERERNLKLTQSFNEYEAEQLILNSLKDGEIAALKQTVADRSLEAEKHKGVSRGRLYIIIALAGSWIVFFAFRVCRFFRLF
jgi:hypothetical protein